MPAASRMSNADLVKLKPIEAPFRLRDMSGHCARPANLRAISFCKGSRWFRKFLPSQLRPAPQIGICSGRTEFSFSVSRFHFELCESTVYPCPMARKDSQRTAHGRGFSDVIGIVLIAGALLLMV